MAIVLLNNIIVSDFEKYHLNLTHLFVKVFTHFTDASLSKVYQPANANSHGPGESVFGVRACVDRVGTQTANQLKQGARDSMPLSLRSSNVGHFSDRRPTVGGGSATCSGQRRRRKIW